MPEPTIGRIVHYKLSAEDATQINRRRTNGESIAKRIKQEVVTLESGTVPQWPLGAQAHIGNVVAEGDVFPMLITRVWPNDTHGVNGQVFLDGNDALWATSVAEGDGPHQYQWPTRS